MLYTNYKPTPTPISGGKTFKIYQEPKESTLQNDVDDGFIHKYDVPDTMDLATTDASGKVFIVPPKVGYTHPIGLDFLGRRFVVSSHTTNTAGLNTAHLDGFASFAASGTRTDGADASGAATIFTGTEASGSDAYGFGFSCTNTTFQSRWGWYAWHRMRLPTAMTSLANRVFLVGLISDTSSGESYDADTGGAAATNYLTFRYRADTDATANWWVRCGNGANDSNTLDTGVAVVTGTVYDFEMWCDRTNYFVRVNGGSAVQLGGTTRPATTVAFDYFRHTYARNTAAVTGTGSIAVACYEDAIYLT